MKRMAMGTAMTTRPLVRMDRSTHLVPSRCPLDASPMTAPLSEERCLSPGEVEQGEADVFLVNRGYRGCGGTALIPGRATAPDGSGPKSVLGGLVGVTSASAGGEPRLAELAALLLGGATPDARLLVGGQGELEAGSMASHARHTRLAASICSMAGPVVPTGKKRSVRCTDRQPLCASPRHPIRPSGST